MQLTLRSNDTEFFALVSGDSVESIFHVNLEGIQSVGLGINIIASRVPGPVLVSAVAALGGASANGWLRKGDQLLLVGHTDVSQTTERKPSVSVS